MNLGSVIRPASMASMPSRETVNAGLASLVCALLFLAVNPFLALLLLAVLSRFQRVPTPVFLVCAVVSLTLFFYLRDYGVEWYPNSTDDVPQYISIYEDNFGLSFGDVLQRFLAAPNGNELLWQGPWWVVLNVFNASDDTFVFLHYLVNFTAIILALRCVSRVYLIPLCVVYFFLTPISVDAIAHIWRQQLAFSMFLAGVGLYMAQGNRRGRWLIYGSMLMHLSCVFYSLLFVAAEWVRRRGGFENKLRVSVLLALILLVMPIVSSAAVFFLDSIGLARIMTYFEGYDVDVVRVYLIIGVYAVPMLIVYYLLPNDAMNNLFMVLCFAVFSIVMALPGANSLYDRLLMFVLPLWGLYFFRTMLLNFSPRFCLPVTLLIFAIGVSRLHAPIAEGYGVANFLAHGNAFDPFMGTVRMLTNL